MEKQNPKRMRDQQNRMEEKNDVQRDLEKRREGVANYGSPRTKD